MAIKYFEDYKCGCVSEVVNKKKDLIGFCAIHGYDRKKVWTIPPQKRQSKGKNASR